MGTEPTDKDLTAIAPPMEIQDPDIRYAMFALRRAAEHKESPLEFLDLQRHMLECVDWNLPAKSAAVNLFSALSPRDKQVLRTALDVVMEHADVADGLLDVERVIQYLEDEDPDDGRFVIPYDAEKKRMIKFSSHALRNCLIGT